MSSDFIPHLHTLHQTGQPFVIATVVRAEKPTSAKAGAKASITSISVFATWIFRFHPGHPPKSLIGYRLERQVVQHMRNVMYIPYIYKLARSLQSQSSASLQLYSSHFGSHVRAGLRRVMKQ